MYHAVSILHDHTRGNLTEALKEAIIEMRKDIQIWSWQKLKSDDVRHLYTRIAQSSEIEKKSKT